MNTLVEAAIPVADFALKETFVSVPEARFELLPTITYRPETGPPLLRAKSDRAVIESLPHRPDARIGENGRLGRELDALYRRLGIDSAVHLRNDARRGSRHQSRFRNEATLDVSTPNDLQGGGVEVVSSVYRPWDFDGDSTASTTGRRFRGTDRFQRRAVGSPAIGVRTRLLRHPTRNHGRRTGRQNRRVTSSGVRTYPSRARPTHRQFDIAVTSRYRPIPGSVDTSGPTASAPRTNVSWARRSRSDTACWLMPSSSARSAIELVRGTEK